MTAARTLEDGVSNPGGFTGSDFATKARAEIEGLWNAVINEVSSIGGSANAITGVCSPVLIGSYVNGMTFRFTPTANNTTAVTVNWDGKGAVALRQPDGTALIANDVVTGQPIECWYDSAAGYMRMSDWSEQSIAANALAAVSTSLLWTLIGDTTIGSAVAQVEHTFTANAYSHVRSIMSGISCSTTSGSGIASIVTLRNSSAAIITITGPLSFFSTSADVQSLECDFIIDLVTAGVTKSHYGGLRGVYVSSGTPTLAALGSFEAVGASATAPDRVRVAFGSGNIDAGRIMTYGLKA